MVLFLNGQDALLKMNSSLAASVVDEGQAPPDASTVANGADDDNEWDLEGCVRLDLLQRDGSK